MVEVEEATSSDITLTLLETATDDEDVMVVLDSEAVLYVWITFSVFNAVSKNLLLISAAEVEEGTSSRVTAGSDKLLKVRTVEENEAVETDEIKELVTVVRIGVDASVCGVLVMVTVPSDEIGFVVVGVSVAV